ncbi:MAG TPA: nickel transporter [Burkholderiales bacterium]
MATAAIDSLALAALVFVLGLKHGFDPDHLVAIDGFARAAARTRPRFARWAGVFFSLGHGAIVTATAFAVALAAAQWQLPAWLEPLGATISIGVLLALGTANLALLWRSPRGSRVALVGLRGRWLGPRLAEASHPAVMAAVGAAFALSFDTLSNVLLFSIGGAAASALFALLLGVLFTLGMVATDALNGWWVARMVLAADAKAAAASRWMSLAVGVLCLTIAGGGLAAYALPELGAHIARYSPLLSISSLAAILAVALIGTRVRKGAA